MNNTSSSHLCFKAITGLDLCEHFITINELGSTVFNSRKITPPLFHPGLLPPSTGMGARATADMAGKRPLCAMGPMMSALILWSFLIKKKGHEKALLYLHHPIIFINHPPISMDKHRGNNRIPFAPLNNCLRQIHSDLITERETASKTGIRLMG